MASDDILKKVEEIHTIRLEDLEYKTYGGIQHCSVYVIPRQLRYSIAVADASEMVNKEWYLNRCVVYDHRGAPRGAGIGSKMLRQLLAAIKEKNPQATRIVVDPGGYVEPSEENQRQQFRFYVKNGFKATPIEGRLEYVFR